MLRVFVKRLFAPLVGLLALALPTAAEAESVAVIEFAVTSSETRGDGSKVRRVDVFRRNLTNARYVRTKTEVEVEHPDGRRIKSVRSYVDAKGRGTMAAAAAAAPDVLSEEIFVPGKPVRTKIRKAYADGTETVTLRGAAMRIKRSQRVVKAKRVERALS